MSYIKGSFKSPLSLESNDFVYIWTWRNKKGAAIGSDVNELKI